jgi:regulator of cell morphogenesis and NO signaling
VDGPERNEEPTMKITDALRQEHEVLIPQLDALEKAAGSGAALADLGEMVRRLADGLLSHARIEDEVLFPALIENLGGEGGPVGTMKAEHEEIENGFGAFSNIKNLDDAKHELARLVQITRDHFTKEDRMLFPMAEQSLENGALTEMNAQLTERRNEQPLPSF